jgi:hypothetical protein
MFRMTRRVVRRNVRRTVRLSTRMAVGTAVTLTTASIKAGRNVKAQSKSAQADQEFSPVIGIVWVILAVVIYMIVKTF